jgi:hypothetical protein
MIRLTAQIDSRLSEFAGSQAPFIASLALNRTAVGARDLVRENLPKRFRLRNNWTRGGIQTRTSTKANLVAHVLAPDYMLIQETGGERQPATSRLLAAPSEAMQSNRVTPKSKRPRALLAGKGFIIDMGGGEAGVFTRYGKKRGQIRLMYWLTDAQQYEERFEFERDVSAYVQGRFSVNFATALADALK